MKQWGARDIEKEMNSIWHRLAAILPSIRSHVCHEHLPQNFAGVLSVGKPVFPRGFNELGEAEQRNFRMLCKEAWHVLRSADWAGLSLCMRYSGAAPAARGIAVQDAYLRKRLAVQWKKDGHQNVFMCTVRSSVDGEAVVEYDDGEVCTWRWRGAPRFFVVSQGEVLLVSRDTFEAGIVA